MSAIEAALQAAIDCGDIPCAAAVVATSDETVFEGAFGKPHVSAENSLTPDAIFRFYSMTKAVTSVAAMQLVEAGAIALDAPVADYIPAFAELQVLTGFNDAGKAQLRAPVGQVTTRQLLNHTAGFGYEMFNPLLLQEVTSGSLASAFSPTGDFLKAPLVFDPGSEWQYGISTDWLGRLIEIVSGEALDAVFRKRIFEPLGMQDTHFNLPAEKASRLVATCHRQANGSLAEAPLTPPSDVEFFSGGGGLYSTAADYTRFVRALLRGGELDGARILRRDTVTLMGENQIADITTGRMQTVMPEASNSVNMFPNSSDRFGLGFLINGEPGGAGKAAGSLSWAGLANTYFWIDPARDICAVLLMQLFPFFDNKAVGVLSQFERAIYSSLKGQ